jgi:hypothetical protein
LDAAGHRRRSLDLHDEVDRSHVDAQLERRRGDQGRQASGLEVVLHGHALLARERAVVRAHQLFSRQLVESRGQTLGKPPAVHEEQRRPVGADQLDEARLDGRPQRRPRRSADRPFAERRGPWRLGRRRRARELFERDLDAQVERLAGARVHDADRPRTPNTHALAAAQETRHLVERALRGAQADALRWRGGALGQPLEREGQVRAALAADERMDLVDDHDLDSIEHPSRVGSEDQEERLRGGDQDVGGTARHGRPLRGRRIPGAYRDLQPLERIPAPGGLARDPDQRRAQVALHVNGQGPQRRHVRHAAAPFAGRRRREHQPVDGGQEGGERLA